MSGDGWQEYLKDEELQRVTLLKTRRALKRQTLDEISTEIARLMNRAIRRKRRAEGKE